MSMRAWKNQRSLHCLNLNLNGRSYSLNSMGKCIDLSGLQIIPNWDSAMPSRLFEVRRYYGFNNDTVQNIADGNRMKACVLIWTLTCVLIWTLTNINSNSCLYWHEIESLTAKLRFPTLLRSLLKVETHQ